MRRSSFTVYFEDGRVESLSREEIRTKLSAGELSNRDAISIANGRPKQPGAFPAFSDVAPPVTNDYPIVGGTKAPADVAPRAATTSSRRAATTGSRAKAASSTGTASGARAVQRASMRPPSVSDSVSQRRVVRDVRTTKAPASGASSKVTTIDGVGSALDWGEPIAVEDFSGPIEELREKLWRASPPAIVGCDAIAGRHAAIRSAAERQSLIRKRIDDKPNAGDRILLEDCKSMVDLSLRVVTQPAKWRDWQQRSREDGAPLSIGVFGKVRRRLKTTAAPRVAKKSAPVSETDDLAQRVRRLKRLHPHMDDDGIRMLVASGADLFEDSASAKRVVTDKKKKKKNKAYTTRKKSTAPSPTAEGKEKPGFLDLPPWLSGLFSKK